MKPPEFYTFSSSRGASLYTTFPTNKRDVSALHRFVIAGSGVSVLCSEGQTRTFKTLSRALKALLAPASKPSDPRRKRG